MNQYEIAKAELAALREAGYDGVIEDRPELGLVCVAHLGVPCEVIYQAGVIGPGDIGTFEEWHEWSRKHSASDWCTCTT